LHECLYSFEIQHAFDYTGTFEKDVLPLVRNQNGFKDEITFSSPGGTDITAITLWDNKANGGLQH
jgi:hypothetical protein